MREIKTTLTINCKIIVFNECLPQRKKEKLKGYWSSYHSCQCFPNYFLETDFYHNLCISTTMKIVFEDKKRKIERLLVFLPHHPILPSYFLETGFDTMFAFQQQLKWSTWRQTIQMKPIMAEFKVIFKDVFIPYQKLCIELNSFLLRYWNLDNFVAVLGSF